MNKDFYDRLPGFVCEQLDILLQNYGKEEWFPKAWEEYRQHVLNEEDMFNIKMPMFVFKNYIGGESK